MLSEGRLLLEKDGAVATLVIDRPEKANAITLAMWRGLRERLAEVEADDAIDVLIVRGGGERAFSAGADIHEFSRVRFDAASARTYDEANRAAEEALANLSKPTIAQIHGACVGGGAQLALACDLRFADTRARFGIPPAKLGIVYGLASTKRLVDAVGSSTAKLLLYSGELLTARRAYEVGAFDELHEPEDLALRVRAYAAQVGSRSRHSVRAAKRIVGKISMGQVEDDDETTRLRDATFGGSDYQEGVHAFVEGRAPEFE